MKIDLKNCTEEQLWKYVATHLKNKGIDSVLVGGAVVSVYSEGAYRSGDLDFILKDMFVKKLPEAMKEIGFVKKGTKHYSHPECKHLTVEFPGSFLEIGDDSNIIPKEVECDGVKIKILSPTDCVKDRLASYIYFKARECLDQAVLVAQKHPVDIIKVKKWCESENAKFAFNDFLEKSKK